MPQTITESAAGPWANVLPVPQDGERVTADADGEGDGPIVPTFQELLDRDAQLALGTVTLKAATSDGTGEAANSPTAGLISTTGDVVAQDEVVAGQRVEAGTEHFTGTADGDAHQSQKALLWDSVNDGAADGPNPPITEPLPNQLRALNTPKAWAILRTISIVGYFVDGCGFTAATVVYVPAPDPNPRTTVQFSMAQAMMSADGYTINPRTRRVASGDFYNWSRILRVSTTVFEIEFDGVDLTTAFDLEIMVDVFGRQAS